MAAFMPVGRLELMIAALAALSLADLSDLGYVTVPVLILLLLAFAAIIAALFSDHADVPRGAYRFAAPALALMILMGWTEGRLTLLVLVAGLAAIGLVLALDVSPSHQVPLLASMAGVWTLLTFVPLLMKPVNIDVISLLRLGGLRLIHGLNPYTATYPSTTPGVHALPFTYSPITAILAAPAAQLGDVRYMNLLLAAVSVAALAALALRSHRLVNQRQKLLITSMALAVPLVPMLVWYGWTELYALAPFLLWLLWRDRHPALGVICLALALGAKLTILPFLLPLALWAPRIRRELLGAALIAGALIYLPFMLWTGPHRFFHDILGFEAGLAPRPVSLSLSGLLTAYRLPAVPLAVAGVVLVFTAVALCWLRPRDLGDLLLQGVAFAAASFFLSPSAVFNYWALVGCGVIAALATVGVREPIALPTWRGWRAKNLATAE